tara:strand:+ start:346 stop:498 length:153 start_codon:yes stop_codon:yes gene_type:complete
VIVVAAPTPLQETAEEYLSSLEEAWEYEYKFWDGFSVSPGTNTTKESNSN